MENSFTLTLNDRSIRALKEAIDFTLEKWAGQEQIDQEALMIMRPEFDKMMLEMAFNIEKPD